LSAEGSFGEFGRPATLRRRHRSTWLQLPASGGCSRVRRPRGATNCGQGLIRDSTCRSEITRRGSEPTADLALTHCVLLLIDSTASLSCTGSKPVLLP